MLKSDTKAYPAFDENKWLKFAFPVTIFSIFLSLTLPNIIFLILQYLNIKPDIFSLIILGTIPVQLSLIFPLWITAFILRNNISISGIKEKFKLCNWRNIYIIECIKVELIILIPLCLITYTVHSLLVYFDYSTSSPIEYLLSRADLKGIILIFFVSVFLAPIAEEIIFRRMFYSFSLKLMNKYAAITITSFLFAALHGGLVQILPLALLGCVLQLLYIKHKSIYPCLILHSIHNFIMMTLFIIAWNLS